MESVTPTSPRRSLVDRAFGRGFALSVAALIAPLLLIVAQQAWANTFHPFSDWTDPKMLVGSVFSCLQIAMILGGIMWAVVQAAHHISSRIRGAFAAAPVLAAAAILTLAGANIWLTQPLSTSLMVSGVLTVYLTAGFAAMWVPVAMARQQSMAGETAS